MQLIFTYPTLFKSVMYECYYSYAVGEFYVKSAERDLFLWAVLLNRKNLAMLFWQSGKDHIGGALTASTILRSLAKIARSEEEIDLALELLKNSQ